MSNRPDMSTKDHLRTEDLHLQLSEKYMVYRDLADRCLINPAQIEKQDRRVFYLEPKSVFTEEPRKQNQYRQEFIKAVQQPPTVEPFTLMADDLLKRALEDISDQSSPQQVKQQLAKFFERRQYRLQHKKHKYLSRWAHFAVTSELVDKISLSFSPGFSKIQFEMEQAIKRHQRLAGRDHFDNDEPRPQRIEPIGLINPEDLDCEQRMQKHCSLRVDDIDVYTRIVGYEAACNRLAETFVNRAKWLALSHRYEVYEHAQERVQAIRKQNMDQQRQWLERVEAKGQVIINLKQTEQQGIKELQLIQSKQQAFVARDLGQADALQLTKSYHLSNVPLLAWNQVELKLQLEDLCRDFVKGDMEVDEGNSFSYAVIVQFPVQFYQQTIKTQFAKYDCVPQKVNPIELGNRDLFQLTLQNQKKYGKGLPGSSVSEQLDIEQQQEALGTQYLNSIEKAIFGEFNNGQLEDFPRVRLKQAHWLPYVCFQPAISQEQMRQTALLASDQNPLDKLASHFLDLVGINDLASVNMILESLSVLHYDQGKSNTLQPNLNKRESIYSEQQQLFLNLFTECLQFEPDKVSTQLPKHSLFECQQPLLFAQYLTVCLKAREAKVRLLYTLNAFRSIQKRIALELRELASRDRVAFDVQVVEPSENFFEGYVAKGKHGAERGSESLVMEELIDIKQYRFNGLTQNQMWSTCPVLPKFHVTFGEPVERQEASTEFEVQQDPKKDQAMRQLGRIDFMTEHADGYMLVTDDSGVAVMYDCSLADIQVLEQELLKLVSFYINSSGSTVDRFVIIKEALECEQQFQTAKLQLAFKYLECYEHTCDSLEQQQLVQIITDLMALRPRLNLQASHFKECYSVEVQLLQTQTKLIQEFIQMQMDNELVQNQDIRESLEKTYRLIYEQVDNKWQYFEHPHQELQARKLNEIGVQGAQDVQKLKEKHRPSMFQAKQPTVTLAQFAEMLSMPLSSLQMMLKEHLERDSTVRQSIHENVSFIKLQEGYPIFIQQTEISRHNTVTLVPDGASIGILQLYESLSQVIRVAAASHHTLKELKDTHQPDNGLVSAMQDLVATELLLKQLYTVKAELRGNQGVQSRDLAVIEDASILGNPEKMLFHMKELVASAQDPELIQNPFVLTKIDLKTLEENDFDLQQNKEFRRKISAIAGQPVSHEIIMQTKDTVLDIQTAEALQKILDQSDESLSQDEDDFSKKQKLHEHVKDKQYPRLKIKYVRPNIPSLLEISCNSVEVLRLRHVLVEAYHQRAALLSIFESQSSLLGKEPKVFFSDPFNFETFLNGGNNWKNFVDSGPVTFVPTELAIKEFDPTLASVMNFADPEAFKALVCPLGLEEMRVVVRYEVLNLHLLIAGVRHNQVLLDGMQRKLAEANLLEKGFMVSAPALDLPEFSQAYYDNKRIASDKRVQIQNTMSGRIARMSYNIIAKKLRPKEQVEQAFKRVRQQVADQKFFKVELGLRYLRTARMLLCYDYCEDVAAQLYLDAVRVDLMQELNQIRRRAFLLPPQQMVHRLPPPLNGEHSYANHSSFTDTQFVDEQTNHINHLWTLPSFQEIASLQPDLLEFQRLNVRPLYQYDGQQQRPDLFNTDHKHLIKKHVPQFTQLSAASADQLNIGRFCDFSQAPQVSQQPLVQYLFYFRNLQNLFDLEYFKNTLNCMASSISELEQAVMSGMSFWESPADIDHSPFEHDNKHAHAVVVKMAHDKKFKIKLMTELDHIRDQFNLWETQMAKLQLKQDINQAGLFLNELAHLSYSNILVGLMTVQQMFVRAGQAQKENHAVSALLSLFSHTDDAKVTYCNGFHVNHAVTALAKISIENNVHRPDYNSFYQALLPVMDQHQLNPSEFNLVRGMYTAASVHQRAYRRQKPFVGFQAPRDYSSLDYKLIGVSREVRRTIYANILEVQSQSLQFSHDNQGVDAASYQYNLVATLQNIEDQKLFQRHQIKAYRLKQALMMLTTKKTLPTSAKQLQQLDNQFTEMFSLKIMSQVDEKQRLRQRLSKSKEAQKQTLNMFDQFSIEIDIYQREIQNYMILTSQRMLQRESTALAKAFELNGKRLEVLVDVKQQFAATNDDRDKLNHLDIVNKVSSVQKLLTQMKNRMLSYRQLTGGEGVIIRNKDLQSIIEEFTRSIVKDGEVEMRTRCESLHIQIQTYEDLLYQKDQQIVNLEYKLQHAAQQMTQVVASRVFANGSKQTYDFDKSERHFRLIKDNVYQMEKQLTQKIYQNFERELTKLQQELAEQRKKFQEYQVTLNSHVKATVTENINSLDMDLKKIVSPGFKPERQDLGANYVHLLTGEARQQYKSLNAIQAEGLQQIFIELERLKRKEEEARQDVLALEQLLRKQRMIQNFKWLNQQQKWAEKYQKMQQQLSSNTTLWEQLAESEKRERVLKQELQNTQEQLAVQDKVMERLKDELSEIKKENLKLISFKDDSQKKQAKMEHLEKQIDLVGNINLDKVLASIGTKDRQLETLKHAASNGQHVLDSIYRNQQKQLQRTKEKARQESIIKDQAISKLNRLQAEIQLVQSGDGSSLGQWHDKRFQTVDSSYPATTPTKQYSANQSSLASLHYGLPLVKNSNVFTSKRFKSDAKEITRSSSVMHQVPSTSVLVPSTSVLNSYVGSLNLQRRFSSKQDNIFNGLQPRSLL